MVSNGDLPTRPHANGQDVPSKAGEVSDLIDAVKELIIPFIGATDEDAIVKKEGHGLAISGGGPRTVLVEPHPPRKLQSLLDVNLPSSGLGKDGLLSMVRKVLQYSVNTWDQGFMDKLYASTNAPGVVAELILATLNTNLHVYQVSPALTVIEKATAKQLASMFGFNGPHAGGISQPGGSASNQTSIIIARNTLFPETKTDGYGNRKFVLFTSEHGHYSLEKAAQMFGFGSNAVRSVEVDDLGQMKPSALDAAIQKSKEDGETPFYINATAGTTVLGSYDPIEEISHVAKKHKCWLHVDGSWGGSVVFCESQKYRLKGVDKADSVAINPHKMLQVPMTCSFLVMQDIRACHKANTLPAGYLFHNDDGDSGNSEVWDLADLTPQCGRRGDALKLALSWIYYGTEGYDKLVAHGYDIANYFSSTIQNRPGFKLVGPKSPPCWQVCFYYVPEGTDTEDQEAMTKVTQQITERLVRKGFMIDYAPGAKGKFFRVVVNGATRKQTIDGLVAAIEQAGQELK